MSSGERVRSANGSARPNSRGRPTSNQRPSSRGPTSSNHGSNNNGNNNGNIGNSGNSGNSGSEHRKVVGNYMLGKTIGEGTFGKVQLAVHLPTGEKVNKSYLQSRLLSHSLIIIIVFYFRLPLKFSKKIRSKNQQMSVALIVR